MKWLGSWDSVVLEEQRKILEFIIETLQKENLRLKKLYHLLQLRRLIVYFETHKRLKIPINVLKIYEVKINRELRQYRSSR
jgi:hypothetical protein